MCQGGRGRHESRQGSLVSHHRRTCASCRKALQTCPRQLTSPKLSSACLTAWRVLPTTTGARCQPSCTGLPAAETAAPSQELSLWRGRPALIAGTWTHSSKANDTCQEKNCYFFLAFVWFKSRHQVLPPARSLHPGAELYHPASLSTHRHLQIICDASWSLSG